MSRINTPYEKSFAYHIKVELGLNLDDIWNWKKNNKLGINPYEIAKQSHKKIWLYCLEKDYHNYDKEGNKIGYEISCANFYKNRRCGYCASKKIHYKDSLAYNYPQVAKMIAIEENNLTFEDCYNIACKSGKKYYFKCDKCQVTSRKTYSLNLIYKLNKFPCKFCSDGLPITEKFMANVLKQLDIKFKTQLNKTDFDWCGYFKYDFYIPSLNMIIETHGEQHYIENKTNHWKTLEQEQWNDLFKYKCANSHVNNYIVIDCRYSTLEWMENNVIKELSEYFDLSNINWELVWEESQNSLCIECWNLWNDGLHSIIKISKKLKLDQHTVIKYLKRGSECNKCDYKLKE